MTRERSAARAAAALAGAVIAAVLAVVLAVVLTGCASGSDGVSGGRGDPPSSPAPTSAPTGTDPAGTFEVPAAVDRRGFCSSLDPSTVSEALGVRVTRLDPVRPGTELAPGLRAEFFRCGFGAGTAAPDVAAPPPRGLLLSFQPRSAGTAGDVRRSLEAEAPLDAAGCAFDDVAGVDTERGYVQTCTGAEATSASRLVAAGTAVRVDVAEGHLYCQEYSPPEEPSGVLVDDVVMLCEHLFAAVARAEGRG